MIDGSWTIGSIAQWKNGHWQNVGDGSGFTFDPGAASPGRVFDMTVWDPDGPGPQKQKLVVVGDFYYLGPSYEPIHTVAVWDGSHWSGLGDGIQWGNFDMWGTGWPAATAVTVYNGELYVAGAVAPGDVFDETYCGILKWDGAAWIPVGNAKTIGGWPTSLAVYDDGAGPKLYMGGYFSQIWTYDPAIGYTPLPNTGRLVAWNGTTWQGKGSSIPAGPGVKTLRVLDVDGAGPQPTSLFVGAGDSIGPGGVTYRVTGLTTTTVPAPIESDPPAVFDDGTGPALYATGSDQRIYRWNGISAPSAVSSWELAIPQGYSPCCEPRGGFVKAATVYDFGAGPRLVLGGYFAGTRRTTPTFERNLSTYGVMTWDGSAFGSPSPSGAPVFLSSDVTLSDQWGGFSGGVLFDEDGAGPLPASLHVAGHFNLVGGRYAASFARRDGDTWTPVGSGFDQFDPPMLIKPVVLHESAGDSVCAISVSTANFSTLGVYRYAAGSWTKLGPTFAAKDIAVFDDGTGERLYATGQFAQIGDTTVNNIAVWNGVSWAPVGGGLTLVFSPNTTASGTRLATHNDGSGQRLFVFGSFNQAGGVAASGVARWSGSAWSAAGSLPGPTSSTFDAAISTASGLYVKRSPAVGGISIYRWNGSVWEGIASPGGANAVLAGTDGGPNGKLYATTQEPNGFGNQLWTYDGSSWVKVEHGMLWGAPSAMLSMTDDEGPALYFLGGNGGSGIIGLAPDLLTSGGWAGLSTIDSISSIAIARLGCTAAACLGDLNADATVDAADLAILLGAWGTSAGDLDGDASTSGADLALLLGAWGPCG